MAEGYRIWLDRISTSYGTQPAPGGSVRIGPDRSGEVFTSIPIEDTSRGMVESLTPDPLEDSGTHS